MHQYYLVWMYKFNAKWHMGTEGTVMYQRGVPNVAGNVAIPVPPENGTLGAFAPQDSLAASHRSMEW